MQSEERISELRDKSVKILLSMGNMELKKNEEKYSVPKTFVAYYQACQYMYSGSHRRRKEGQRD